MDLNLTEVLLKEARHRTNFRVDDDEESFDRPLASVSEIPTRSDHLVLSRMEIFRRLPKADVFTLVKAFEVRDLAPGTVVFEQGKVGPDELYVVLAGRLAITRVIAGGQRRSRFLGPGETLGELYVLDPGPHTRTATALTHVRLATLSRENYLDWLLDRPHAAERLLRSLARRLQRTDDDALEILFIDVGARLAKALTDLAGRFGRNTRCGVVVDHGLSQTQLAEMVGTTRETLNKQLSGFVQLGWLTSEPGRFVIRESERLELRASQRNA